MNRLYTENEIRKDLQKTIEKDELKKKEDELYKKELSKEIMDNNKINVCYYKHDSKNPWLISIVVFYLHNNLLTFAQKVFKDGFKMTSYRKLDNDKTQNTLLFKWEGENV